MERPETISPEGWDRLNDKQKEFMIFHVFMHGALQKFWGVSREEYYARCQAIAEEGFD